MVKLQKACRSYTAWKAKHDPEVKPWLFPEQNTLPRLNPADIGKWELTSSPVLDERHTIEAAATSDGGDEDDDSSGLPLGSAEQLTPATNGGFVAEEIVDVPVAAPEPAIPDTAVVAGAN